MDEITESPLPARPILIQALASVCMEDDALVRARDLHLMMKVIIRRPGIPLSSYDIYKEIWRAVDLGVLARTDRKGLYRIASPRLRDYPSRGRPAVKPPKPTLLDYMGEDYPFLITEMSRLGIITQMNLLIARILLAHRVFRFRYRRAINDNIRRSIAEDLHDYFCEDQRSALDLTEQIRELGQTIAQENPEIIRGIIGRFQEARGRGVGTYQQALLESLRELQNSLASLARDLTERELNPE